MAFTSTLVYLSATKLVQGSQNKSELYAEYLGDEIKLRMLQVQESVQSLASLSNATTTAINEISFTRFSASLRQRHGFLDSSYYLPWTPAQAYPALQSYMRETGYAEFRIHRYVQTSDTDDTLARKPSLPIVYIDSPHTQDQALRGFDLLSVEALQTAIHRAIHSGLAVGVHEPQPTAFDDAMLVLQAIYRDAQMPASLDQRLQAVEAVVGIRVNMHRLLRDLKGADAVRLVFEQTPPPTGPTSRPFSLTQTGAHAGDARRWHISEHRSEIDLVFADTPFTLHVINTTDWLHTPYETVLLSGGAGAAISLLFFTLLFIAHMRTHELQQRNAQIRQQVDRRTMDLMYETALLEREIYERERAESESVRLSQILDESSEEIYVVRQNGRGFIQVNRGALRNLGYTQAQINGLTLDDIIAGLNPQALDALIAPLHANAPHTLTAELHLRRKDGSVYPAEMQIHCSNVHDDAVYVILAMDISRRKKAQEKMLMLSSALEQTADIVLITDNSGIIEYVNPAFESTTGYSRSEVLGERPSMLSSGAHSAGFYQRLWQTVIAGEDFQDVIINKRKDGSLYYEEKTITPLKNEAGEIIKLVSTGKDITERMRAQERLRHMAHHDKLTGLPNRALFMERLNHALSRGQREEQRMAVLFMDLDGFKQVNDSLGHDIGDGLLQEVAKRLLGSVRTFDTVARLGGDEFTILFEELKSEQDVRLISQKILNIFSEPIDVQAHALSVTASIGIATFPGDGTNERTLMKHADTAMYKAKALGKNNVQFYCAQTMPSQHKHLSDHIGIRQALERDQFLLRYQPLCDLNDGTIIGVEALLRWQHPQQGLLAPAAFLPLLEQTGQLIGVGEWVLREACQQHRQWQQQGLAPPRLSVNLSTMEFMHEGFIKTLSEVLAQTGLSARWLRLEMNEQTLMHNTDKALRLFEQIADIGASVAIDHYGSGCSSLDYLNHSPLDTLKVDSSFIADVTLNNEHKTLLRAIVKMACGLGMQVIAEGVETQAQAAFLQDCGCDGGQGFYFCRALDARAMTRWLNQAHAPASELDP